MSALEPITDYVDSGKALLMSQYRGKERIEGLLGVFLAHHQTIENALQQIGPGRTLLDATGTTLDNIGKLVGIDRNGLADASYRVLLYAKVAENNGDATLQTLVRVASALFQTDNIFCKTPNSVARAGQKQGAYVVLMIGSPQVPKDLYGLIVKLLQQSLPSGVQFAHVGVFDASGCFAYAGDRPWVGGWGDVKDPTVGAPLADLILNSAY